MPVFTAQAPNFGMSRSERRQDVGQKESERRLAGAIGAGEGPGTSAVPLTQLDQDLSGDVENRRRREVTGRRYPALEIVRELHRPVETSPNVDQVRERDREFLARHEGLSE